MNRIEASVIIPTKNRISRLKVVLNILAPQIKANHEVIIVMDGCRQDTLDEFAGLTWTFTPKVLICQTGKGAATARNQGAAQASGKILIFMDDDRIPGDNFIENHIAMHRQQHCVIAGKRMQLFLTEESIVRLGEILKSDPNAVKSVLKNAKHDYTWYNKFLMPVPWLSCVTSNLSIHKSDFIAIGMFDEHFVGWGWEDSDLGYRIVKRKIRIKKKSSVVNYHLAHPISTNLEREELNNYRYFFQKVKGDYSARFWLAVMRFLKDFGSGLKSLKTHAKKRMDA